MSLLSTMVPAAGIALVIPVLVPLLFGDSFRGAVPMALILMLASIANTGPGVLGSGLSGTLRRPGIAGVGEILALVVTVVGLLVLLPPLGGVGAAIVSVVAYSVNFAWLLHVARRQVGGTLRDYLIPTRHELWGLVAVARRLAPRRWRDT
jgi:O-antigen/teichoic acid export membrane protein